MRNPSKLHCCSQMYSNTELNVLSLDKFGFFLIQSHTIKFNYISSQEPQIGLKIILALPPAWPLSSNRLWKASPTPPSSTFEINLNSFFWETFSLHWRITLISGKYKRKFQMSFCFHFLAFVLLIHLFLKFSSSDKSNSESRLQF
jgi:hypothetical protein